MEDFREKVVEIGGRCLGIMEDYFSGKKEGTDKIREASKMISNAIRVEQMNQVKRNSDRSFGLRLLNYLPKDEKIRLKYIALTNPDLKGLLSARPEK